MITNKLSEVLHDDSLHTVTFYMNDNGFIYSKNNEIINCFSEYENTDQLDHIIQECNTCDNSVKITGRYLLHYYQTKKSGLAHSIAKLSTYLRFIYKYKGSLVIPDNVHINVKNIIDNVYTKVIYLKKGIKYTINNFLFSTYFDMMNNPSILKPENKYPLIIYNNDIYWFRSEINRYVDFKIKHPKIFDKIFVGKFEGQSDKDGKIAKPRTILGCIPTDIVKIFEEHDYVNIDPYKYHIHDVLYYIRHAKKVILSAGTCVHLYAPYVSKDTTVYCMINIIADAGINYNKTEGCDTHLLTNHNEYSKTADTVLRFLNNYKICYYNYHPHFDSRVRKENVYMGNDMLYFLDE